MGTRYKVLQTAVAVLMALSLLALGGTWAWAQQDGNTPALRQYQETTVGANLESTVQGREPEQGSPESTRAEPSRQDPGEQERQASQQGGQCPGAEEIGTVGPTARNGRVGPFNIKGDKFRLTYKTTDLDENGVPFLDVTVLDEDNDEVGGRVIRDQGTETETLTEAPGRFTLEIRAEDLRYEITIEDCTGEDQSASKDQYDDNLGIDDNLGLGNDLGLGDDPGLGTETGQDSNIPEDVIVDTIPDRKALPFTGGPPLFGFAIIGLACVGLGLAVLRSAVRHS